MADLGDTLRPLAESLLAPGEQLLGCCIATRQSAFSGHALAVAVTEDRLILQRMNRKFQPDGEPLSLPPERIAEADAGGGGGGWLTVNAAIMDSVSVTLKLRTTDGEKLKLRMMNGAGPIGGLGGGETQRQGVQALGEWFARHGAATG